MMRTGTLQVCAFIGALVFASATGVRAQSNFQVNGRFKVEDGSLDGARMIVYKNGEKQRTLNSGLAKFTMDLDLNSNYILEFEKNGFVTKRLSFDTHAPAEAITNGFTPFEFVVSLFKQYDGVNTVVFNQPVGMIRFDKNTQDFDYDTDYTKSIQSALEETMRNVAAKQEQEKGREEIEAKEKARAAAEQAKAEAEAAKEKARADAAKAKEEAEAAREKAKADKEAAEAAKREEAMKQAQAKKAADELRAAEARKKAEPPPASPAREPKPVAKPRKPAPPPPPARSVDKGLRKEPVSGEDQRRTLAVRESSEPSPVRPAPVNERSETKPEIKRPVPEILRNEELIVEPNQVIVRIQLDNGKERTEYRKVTHKYGQTFYFKDGQSTSRLVYEREALAEVR